MIRASSLLHSGLIHFTLLLCPVTLNKGGSEPTATVAHNLRRRGEQGSTTKEGPSSIPGILMPSGTDRYSLYYSISFEKKAPRLVHISLASYWSRFRDQAITKYGDDQRYHDQYLRTYPDQHHTSSEENKVRGTAIL